MGLGITKMLTTSQIQLLRTVWSRDILKCTTANCSSHIMRKILIFPNNNPWYLVTVNYLLNV